MDAPRPRRLIVALTLVAAWMAVPATAGAQVAETFAGGMLPSGPTFSKKTGWHAAPLVSMLLPADDDVVTFSASASLDCGSYGELREGMGITEMEYGLDWRFDGATGDHYRVSPDEDRMIELWVRGRIRDGIARGWMRMRVRVAIRGRKKPIACDSGSVRWEARATKAASDAAAPPSGGRSYYGALAQNSLGGEPFTPQPLTFRVSRSGTSIDAMAVQSARACRPEASYEMTNFSPAIRIQPDGSFSKVEQFVLRYPGGVLERFRVDVSGRFVQGGASGTFRIQSSARERGSKTPFETCDSGVLAWTATT